MNDSSSTPGPPIPTSAPSDEADAARPPDEFDDDAVEQRNILTLMVHQMLFRTAWIFKTESVIMPAFLDSISGAGWVRGMLPPLNRFGQSIAPLLMSDRLSRSTLKSRWLARTTFLMSLPFLLLGTMLILPVKAYGGWFVIVFLAAYGTFFCLHGINQASFNTIQGKLIRPHRRGRLIAIAGYVGSPLAVLMAWLLLRPWTQSDPPQFGSIFLFTGFTFLLASFASRHVQERSDPPQSRSAIDVRQRFADAWTAVKIDPHLRRLCQVAALFVSAQLLFPHYQRLGRQLPGYDGGMLMVWVIAQNLSAAVFSWGSGRIADRFGTRRALRGLTFLTTVAPLLPLVLAEWLNVSWYWVTFAWLGLVPVTFRMFLNYALELADRQRHPIYVSTVVLSMAPPILLSPLVGECVERLGYTGPFIAVSGVIVAAWLLTLTMVEPREPGFTKAQFVTDQNLLDESSLET